MASYNQTSFRYLEQQQQQRYFEITTKYKQYSRHMLPERFARGQLQPTNNSSTTTTRSSNYNYIGNKLLLHVQPGRQALHHTLRALLFLLLILLLSNWIAQASAAAVVTSTQAHRHETPTQSTTKQVAAQNVDVVGIAYNSPEERPPPSAPPLSKNAESDFNSSSFISTIISASDVISLKETSANGSGGGGGGIDATGAKSNNRNRSITSTSKVGSASAALITTSSIWDPLVGGAQPTDISLVATPPPPEQGSSEDDESDDVIELPPWQAIIVCIILMFIIVGTVVGNVLVCLAVCMVRKLRRPCNYLLVSLALSDLCVAVLVMPMAMLYELLDKWNFGPIFCDIWVSFDVLCCTASILNLCAISVDRYLAITKPLEYGVKRTPRRMMACVALVWLVAASISLPPLLILGNEHMDEHGTPICIVCQNFAYQIYATLGSFYIPLSVMLFVYYQIFRAARRIVLEEKRAQTHLQHALNGTGSPPGNTDLTVLGGSGSGNGQRHSNTSLSYSTCGGGLSAHHHASGGSGGGVSGSSGLLGSPHQKKLRFQLAKEKKASTTLGIIMSAFTICWLPFFILALIRPFVETESVHVPASLASLFLWLGYANSLLNPIIYATLNRDFRKPFQEILYFRCSSLNTMMRENYYQDQYGEPPSQRVMLGDERQAARESFL